MIKKRILICDDDNTQYENLVAMIGDAYEVLRSYHYKHVLEDLKQHAPIHLLILDLGFAREEYTGHECIPDVIAHDANIKIVVYSGILGDLDRQNEALEIARDLMHYPQVVGFLSPSEPAAKVEFEIHKALGTSKWLQSSGGVIWLLHISDPQFGGHGLLGSAESFAVDIVDTVQSFVDAVRSPDENWEREFPFIALMTGDLTEHGRPDEFDKASIFAERLSTKISELRPDMRGLIGKHNVVIVPGNHDINWDILFAQNIHPKQRVELSDPRMEFKDGAENCNLELTFLKRYSWLPFCEMQLGADGDEKNKNWAWHPGYRIVNLKKELRLILVCVNSSLWEVNHIQHNAIVPKDVWLEIQTNLQAIDSKKEAARILLIHHSLDYDLDVKDRLRLGESSGEREELINKLSGNCNFCAILTGHIHKFTATNLDTNSQQRNLVHVGAGTFRSSDVGQFEAPQFNLIRIGGLSPETNKYNSFVVYPFRWSEGKFCAQNAFERGMKSWKEFELLY